jgi:hypothetical protein
MAAHADGRSPPGVDPQVVTPYHVLWRPHVVSSSKFHKLVFFKKGDFVIVQMEPNMDRIDGKVRKARLQGISLPQNCLAGGRSCRDAAAEGAGQALDLEQADASGFLGGGGGGSGVGGL